MRFLNHYKNWLIKNFLKLQYAARSDMRVLIILLVIAAFIVIIIAITFILLRQSLVRRRRMALLYGSPDADLRKYFYLGAAAISLLFVLAITLPLSSNSNICGKVCHQMNPAYQSWLRSAHAAVPCRACHDEAGLVELTKISPAALFSGPKRKFKIINADNRYSQTKVPSAKCLRCHSPDKRRFTARLGLNMSSRIHIKHLNAQLRCTTCHNRVAHPQAEKFSPLKETKGNFKYKDFLKMKTGCWRCHREGGTFINVANKKIGAPYDAPNGATAPTKCKTCHNTDWNKKPAMHKPDDFGRPWKRGIVHGVVAREDFSVCQGCHDKNTWCSTKCHKGITMPHIKNWRVLHRAQAKKNRQVCSLCHNRETGLYFCGNRCHHDKFRVQFKLDPSVAWKSGLKQHGIAALATKGKPCFRCHDQKTWCTTQCHKGITMPHGPNWRHVHYKYAVLRPTADGKNKERVCEMCHSPNKAKGNERYCFECHHKQFVKKGEKFNRYTVMRKSQNNYDNIDPNKGPCPRCHGTLNMCKRCHAGQPAGGVR